MSTASTGRPSWVRNSALTVPSRACASSSRVSEENGTSPASRARRRDRQVGHRVVAGGAAGRPRPHLGGAEARLARGVQALGEQLEVHRGHGSGARTCARRHRKRPGARPRLICHARSHDDQGRRRALRPADPLRPRLPARGRRRPHRGAPRGGPDGARRGPAAVGLRRPARRGARRDLRRGARPAPRRLGRTGASSATSSRASTRAPPSPASSPPAGRGGPTSSSARSRSSPARWRPRSSACPSVASASPSRARRST